MYRGVFWRQERKNESSVPIRWYSINMTVECTKKELIDGRAWLRPQFSAMVTRTRNLRAQG
jgi:hypothetical protein